MLNRLSSSSVLFRHHAFVPYGIERESFTDYAFDFGYLLVYVFDEHVGHRTPVLGAVSVMRMLATPSGV